MSAERPIEDPAIRSLVAESRKIWSDTDAVYDLAGRRFALRCAELEPYFRSRTFRLGIIGNPNRGKTTLAFSAHKTFGLYGFPSQYVDLDIYTHSGRAISGEIGWAQRPKRADAPRREVLESVRRFRKARRGIIVGDFPGRPDNPYQGERLKAVDMALVLGDNPKERLTWLAMAAKVGKPATWLRTNEAYTRKFPMDPTVYNLNRDVHPATLDLLTALTRILENVARLVGVKTADPGAFFSEPERVILEEVLDFEFAPYDIDGGRM